MPDRLAYRFGPLEPQASLGPLRRGQSLLLAAAAIVAVLAVDRFPSAGGAGVAVLALLAGTALAVPPIGSLSAAEWSPIVARFLWRRQRGGFRSPLPEAGVAVAGRPPSPVTPSRPPAPPPALRGLRIVETEYRGHPIGMIDDRGRALTAVLACRSGSFSMLDAEAQERRLARWGTILAGAASGPVRRLQWIERTVPAQGDELARHLYAERDPEVPLRGIPLIDSYLELISSTAQVALEHEILLAVQVDGRDRAAEQTLLEETERLARSLEAAEVTVLGALSGGRLARAVRTAFDPYARAELAALDAADPDRDGLEEPSAWPLADREHWDRYVSDGSEHVTWWVAGWPRVPVSPMFMEAVLARASAVRTFSVTFEPVSPARSTREVEAQVTRDRADHELRRRFGQSETARQRQARDANAQREAELAQGHGEVRLAGFVTVSARDADALRAACGEVLEHAARARLELRRLYGRQAEAFSFTLPLCRGLR